MNKLHLVKNYKHVRGVHCATAALRNLLRHATGVTLSEAMIFGIGSGLNFTYSRFGPSPVILTMGRGVDIEVTFPDAMGISAETRFFDTPGLAWSYVRQQIDLDRPVLLDTDMFSLPYFREFSDPRMAAVHFGGHKLLAIGYNDDTEEAWVGDYAWDPQTLPYSVLARARDAHDCPDPPMNRTDVLHFPDKPLPLSIAILIGLERMHCLMRNPALTFIGLRALERFCRQVTRWNVVLKEEFEMSVVLASHMMERAGTGGGNFRRFHYRFLSESAEILKDRRFNAAAAIYAEVARKWRELSGLLDECEGSRSRGLYAPGGMGGVLADEIWKLECSGLAATEEILRDHLRSSRLSTVNSAQAAHQVRGEYAGSALGQ